MPLEKISFMFIHVQKQHFHVEQDTLQGFLPADQTAACRRQTVSETKKGKS